MAGLLVRKFIARCKQGDVVYPQNMKISPAFARDLWNWEKNIRNQENLNWLYLKQLIYLSHEKHGFKRGICGTDQ
jgi:hypothetical protein